MTDRQFLVLRWVDEFRWDTPRQMGATDGSYHSAVLAQLVRLGFVERKKIHSVYCSKFGQGVTVGGEPCSCKGSCQYRRTPAGTTEVLGRRPIEDLEP